MEVPLSRGISVSNTCHTKTPNARHNTAKPNKTRTTHRSAAEVVTTNVGLDSFADPGDRWTLGFTGNMAVTLANGAKSDSASDTTFVFFPAAHSGR